MAWADAAIGPSVRAPVMTSDISARMPVSCNRAHGPLANAPAFALKLIQQAPRVLPTDRVHEGVDIASRLSAEVDVVGMLVHIERQDRRGAGERMAVVGRPLIDELAIARRPG